MAIRTIDMGSVNRVFDSGAVQVIILEPSQLVGLESGNLVHTNEGQEMFIYLMLPLHPGCYSGGMAVLLVGDEAAAMSEPVPMLPSGFDPRNS